MLELLFWAIGGGREEGRTEGRGCSGKDWVFPVAIHESRDLEEMRGV